jgi:hypothetical protein
MVGWLQKHLLKNKYVEKTKMKRDRITILGIMLFFIFTACGNVYTASGQTAAMRISIETNVGTVVFGLNNSRAAKDLYEQLPLTVAVKDYGGIEKVFNPPKKLNTADTPMANAQTGTFAYYEPWNNVVMFYGNFGSDPGLYELGHIISGSEYVKDMSGEIQIEKDSSRK